MRSCCYLQHILNYTHLIYPILNQIQARVVFLQMWGSLQFYRKITNTLKKLVMVVRWSPKSEKHYLCMCRQWTIVSASGGGVRALKEKGGWAGPGRWYYNRREGNKWQWPRGGEDIITAVCFLLKHHFCWEEKVDMWQWQRRPGSATAVASFTFSFFAL